MPFKVEVGPPQIAIHQAQTVLVTDPAGQVDWPSDKGLYFFDTRLISAWAVYANGTPWDLLNGGAITYDTARIYLTNRSFLTEDGRFILCATHGACYEPDTGECIDGPALGKSLIPVPLSI